MYRFSQDRSDDISPGVVRDEETVFSHDKVGLADTVPRDCFWASPNVCTSFRGSSGSPFALIRLVCFA